jgi:hypothetical protein
MFLKCRKFKLEKKFVQFFFVLGQLRNAEAWTIEHISRHVKYIYHSFIVNIGFFTKIHYYGLNSVCHQHFMFC